MLHTVLTHMFQLDLPILEKILRPVAVYFFLIIGLRLAGKRELAQLNPFDLVVLLTLSNTVQNAIIGEDNSITGGLLGAATLLILNYSVVRFLYRHKKLDRLVEGRPDVLIKNGRLRRDHLHRELISVGELKSAMHKQGICSIAEVEEAVLEPSGEICFVQKRPTPETSRHEELVMRLDYVLAEIAQLKGVGR
jgi:uncharacterized membrane protein YcaP (DUF421 family)